MGIESPIHLIFIGIVALLVLGPRRLPELARRLGEGMREFRQAVDAGQERLEHPPEQSPATAEGPHTPAVTQAASSPPAAPDAAPAPASPAPASPAPAATAPASPAPASAAPAQPPASGEVPPPA